MIKEKYECVNECIFKCRFMLNWKCKFYGRCVRCSMLHEVCLADHSKRVILCCQEIANFWQRITLWKSAANSTLCMIKTLKYKNDHIYHQKQSIFENKFLKTSTAVHVWCIYLISGPCGGLFIIHFSNAALLNFCFSCLRPEKLCYLRKMNLLQFIFIKIHISLLI